MIVDSIKNAGMYLGIDKNLDKAIKFMLNEDFSNEKSRKDYAIDGKNVYAWVNEFEQKDIEKGKPEAHNKYGDIHYILEGEQLIGWCRRDELKSGVYDEEKDLEFLEGDINLIKLVPGSFMIVFPEDAHMPDLAPKKGARVKKVVVKFKTEKGD